MTRETSGGRRPSISVIMPTLNAGRVLGACLRAIRAQDYPQDLVEIIVADGGSQDETVAVAKSFGAQVYDNPLKTGEAGKAVALQHARGELVALIDSDNILPQSDWLLRMTTPFADPEIIGAEPLEYTWRPQDGFITRYCALLGVNDPLVFFLGNYDRLSQLSGVWTELELEQKDRGDYLEITLHRGLLPTIGANGTLLRRRLLEGYKIGDYFFDIDFLYDLVNRAGEESLKKFAKVKIGIVHLYCGSDVFQFVRKQKRRVKDYLYYEKIGIRKYPWRVFSWSSLRGRGVIFFIFANLTVLPLFWQSLMGFGKKRDWAWFFHPLACWITLVIYGYNWLARNIFGVNVLDRRNYRQ